MKTIDTNKLCVQPLGRDEQGNIYWYFYGLRLYREECSVPPESLKMLWEEEWKRECEKYFNSKERKMKFKNKVKYYQKKMKSFDLHKNHKNLKKQKESQPKWTVVCNTLEDWYRLAERLRKSKSLWEKKLYNVLSDGFLAAIEKLAEEKGEITKHKFTERRSSARIEEKQRDKDIFINFALRDEQVIEKRQKLELSVGKSHSKSEKRKISEEKKQNEGKDDDEVLSFNLNNTLNLNSEKNDSIIVTDENFYKNLLKILQCIKNHKEAWPFLEPIDEIYAPGYYNIIKNPIDISKMEEKALKNIYKSWQDVEQDFQQMINNCKIYNGPNSDFTHMASAIMKNFMELVKKISANTCTDNGPLKKKVRFQIANNNKNSTSGHIDDNLNTNKSDSKVVRGRKKKRRPVGMKAIEILAKAAEKALEEISSNKFEESSLSSEENSSKFPDLKVCTTQSHPSLYLAKCFKDSAINKDINANSEHPKENIQNNSNIRGSEYLTNKTEKIINDNQNNNTDLKELEYMNKQTEEIVDNNQKDYLNNIKEFEHMNKSTPEMINDNQKHFSDIRKSENINKQVEEISNDKSENISNNRSNESQSTIFNMINKESNSYLPTENFAEPLLQESESLPIAELQNTGILESLSDSENYISPNCSPSAPLYFITSPENKINGDHLKSLNMQEMQNNLSQEHLAKDDFSNLQQNELMHFIDHNEVHNSVPVTTFQPSLSTQIYLYPTDQHFTVCNNRILNNLQNNPSFEKSNPQSSKIPQQLVFTQFPNSAIHSSHVSAPHSSISRCENLPLMTSQGQYISCQPNTQITSFVPLSISAFNQNEEQAVMHKSQQGYTDNVFRNITSVPKNINFPVQNFSTQDKPILSNPHFIHENKSPLYSQGSSVNKLHHIESGYRPYINLSVPLRKQNNNSDALNILSEPTRDCNIYPVEVTKSFDTFINSKSQVNRKNSTQITTTAAIPNSSMYLTNSEHFQQLPSQLNISSYQKSSAVNPLPNSFLQPVPPPSSSQPLPSTITNLEPKKFVPLSIFNTQPESQMFHYNLGTFLGNQSQFYYYVPDKLQNIQKNSSNSVYSPNLSSSSVEIAPSGKEHTIAFFTPSNPPKLPCRIEPNAPLVLSSNNKEMLNR